MSLAIYYYSGYDTQFTFNVYLIDFNLLCLIFITTTRFKMHNALCL